MAIALVASASVPIWRNAALAQRSDWDPALTWEVASRGGTQVAFVRRDNEGRLYYWLTMVYRGGDQPFGTMPGQAAMKRYYYAADCTQGLIFEYNELEKAWSEPQYADDIRDSTVGVGYAYMCAKYGPRGASSSSGIVGKRPRADFVRLADAAIDDVGNDTLDWRALLFPPGELPGWSIDSIYLSVPVQYRAKTLPRSAREVFAVLNQHIGSVTIYVFNTSKDTDDAWSRLRVKAGVDEGWLDKTDVKEERTIGEKAEYFSLGSEGLPILANLTFTRCRAVVSVTLGGVRPKTIISYARNLDARLRKAICREVRSMKWKGAHEH